MDNWATILFRRGENANRTNITPQQGEVLFAYDTGNIYVGDGQTVGGLPVGKREKAGYADILLGSDDEKAITPYAAKKRFDEMVQTIPANVPGLYPSTKINNIVMMSKTDYETMSSNIDTTTHDIFYIVYDDSGSFPYADFVYKDIVVSDNFTYVVDNSGTVLVDDNDTRLILN